MGPSMGDAVFLTDRAGQLVNVAIPALQGRRVSRGPSRRIRPFAVDAQPCSVLSPGHMQTEVPPLGYGRIPLHTSPLSGWSRIHEVNWELSFASKHEEKGAQSCG